MKVQVDYRDTGQGETVAMMSLFGEGGPRARARREDPGTSKAAARSVEKTGSASHQRVVVYEGLKAHPGSTSRELAQALGLDRYTPSRRLPELLAAGWVRKGPDRVCRVGGRPAATWYALEIEDGATAPKRERPRPRAVSRAAIAEALRRIDWTPTPAERATLEAELDAQARELIDRTVAAAWGREVIGD